MVQYYGDVASLWHTIDVCNRCVLVAAWCLKNETVQCVLLGATSVEQLYEDIQAIRVGETFCPVGGDIS